MKFGPKNLITDVGGLKVGSSVDSSKKTGTTVLLPDNPCTASVAIHGGAPGARDVSMLEPDQTIEKVNALVLSGGSVFGLDSCGGVLQWLLENNTGLKVGNIPVPIAPGAILFDLPIADGNFKDNLPDYHRLGYQACERSTVDLELGTCGAGYGATTANLKGGLGSASVVFDSGIVVGAIVAVNAVGSVTMANGKHFWAAPFEINAEFGGLGLPTGTGTDYTQLQVKSMRTEAPTNTTIGIVATNAKLDKGSCKRLATMAHDGISHAVWPAHTPFDGDLLFALSTGELEMENPMQGIFELGVGAATTVARAIARGVHSAVAEKSDLLPVWSDI